MCACCDLPRPRPANSFSTMLLSNGITVRFLVILVIVGIVAGQGRNPCHRRKNAQGRGVLCEGVELPPNLCNSCRLKPTARNGNFFNCKSIYTVDNPQCKAEMRKYVNRNPCDWKRRQQLNRFLFLDREGLDYFLYSICEECCDCIQKGTKPNMFESLRKKHTVENPTLYTPKRGNCPSHAHFDVCKVLPDIRYITSFGGKKGKKWPKICPLLREWFLSPASANWLNNQNAFSRPPIRRFLNLLNSANSCSMKEPWTRCLIMEQKQNRV